MIRNKIGRPKKINSKRKGAHGELEFAALLGQHGFEARRGLQYKGGTDSPDVICDSLPWVHFEVKRCQQGVLYEWLAQAERDAGLDKVPVVAHRRNHQQWVAIVPMGIFLELLRKVQ